MAREVPHEDPGAIEIRIEPEELNRILAALARVKYAGWRLERILAQVAALVPYQERRKLLTINRPKADHIDEELQELQSAILAVIYVPQKKMEQLRKGH